MMMDRRWEKKETGDHNLSRSALAQTIISVAHPLHPRLPLDEHQFPHLTLLLAHLINSPTTNNSTLFFAPMVLLPLWPLTQTREADTEPQQANINYKSNWESSCSCDREDHLWRLWTLYSFDIATQWLSSVVYKTKRQEKTGVGKGETFEDNWLKGKS